MSKLSQQLKSPLRQIRTAGPVRVLPLINFDKR
jgi:hypothetical protein